MVDGRLRLIGAAVALGVAAAACGASGAAEVERPTPAVRVALVGDVMTGRSVAPIAAADAEGLFRDVRRVIRDADLAAANMESPLTRRPHASANPYALEADPATAHLLADAGFDVASVANNHAGDAGPASVLDTVEALSAAGIDPVGGGVDVVAAGTPVIRDVDGVTLGLVAFDASGQGLAATDDTPGIAHWDEAQAAASIMSVRDEVDVLVVSLHGGVPGGGRPDPVLSPIAERLASWGVDVVWGHGSHEERPIDVVDPDGDGRPTLVATSLGNFLFDQVTGGMGIGPILEVMVDAEGVVAHRIGDTSHHDLRVHFDGWRVPDADAVAMTSGSWWVLDRAFSQTADQPGELAFTWGDVIAASAGDLDGDGDPEVLVSYRHPAVVKAPDTGPTPATDASGRSAHLAVLDEGGPIWMSRRPPHPVGDLAACDGTAVFAHTTLDAADVVATGAGTWSGFGFVLEPELSGGGTIGCADVDGDGRTEPVVTDRG